MSFEFREFRFHRHDAFGGASPQVVFMIARDIVSVAQSLSRWRWWWRNNRRKIPYMTILNLIRIQKQRVLQHNVQR